MYHALIISLLVLLSLYSKPANSNEPFSFAVIGDLPYGVGIGKQSADTEQLISQLNNDADLEWVLHVGDIKTGSSSCSDKMFEDRLERFSKFSKPFILTPGDNDWTDCHRVSAGGFEPLERLETLRTYFFERKKIELTKKELNLIQQPDVQEQTSTIENFSWFRKGIQFSTIHIVGSMNASAKFSPLSKAKRTKADDDEVAQRELAALAWLEYTFEQAKINQAAGVFIAIHANPGLDLRWAKETKPRFNFFNEALAKKIKAFNRPVVLAHGDSHYARIDSPILDGRKPHPKFLRLESFGENNNAWIKVTADASSASVFSFSFFDRVTTAGSD